MSGEQQTEGGHLLRWVAFLATAEAMTVTVTAAAVRLGPATTEPLGRTTPPLPPLAMVAMVAVGGLVAGSTVGRATAHLLHPRAVDLPVRRWLTVTAAMAAAGWVVASCIRVGTEAGQGPGESRRWPMIVAGLGLALLLGAGHGWTRSASLKHQASFPFRWVAAGTLAWAPAAAFAAVALTPAAATWSSTTVLGLAAGTGVLGGTALALTLGWSAPLLTGPAAIGRVLLAARGSHRLGFVVPRGVIGLKVQGARTGTWYSLPVMAAGDGLALIVRPGHADRKSWWRNLIRPSRVELLRTGTWETAEAWVIGAQDISYPQALAAYRRQFPRVDVPADACLVRIIPTAPVGSRPVPARR